LMPLNKKFYPGGKTDDGKTGNGIKGNRMK
jgi:hypothetical protein